MSLTIRNGRLQKQFFLSTAYGPREGWIDCGPAPELSRKDRALLAMSYFERRGRTDSKWYELARRITYREMWGISI